MCDIHLDNILVISKSAEEHEQHLHEVFDLLRKHRLVGVSIELYTKRSMCSFCTNELHFLTLG